VQAFAKARADLRDAQAELTNCVVEIDRYRRERDEALKEVERLRVQLAGCGVAALANTEKSQREQSAKRGDYVWCKSYEDVIDAVAREIDLRRLNDELVEMIKKFGHASTDVLEQMLKGKWVDSAGHDVSLNQAMHDVKDAVVDAVNILADGRCCWCGKKDCKPHKGLEGK